MGWRKGAQVALGILLLVGFQLYGVAELVRNEPPRGSVFGVVYSERTLAPIPNAYVRLELVEPFDERLAAKRRSDDPYEMPYRQQGWSALNDPESLLYPFNRYVWETYTDSRGQFRLRGIPAGVYEVLITGKVHRWQPEEGEPHSVVVREGERVDVSLALKPADPFLELIHPQAVYYPDEPLRVGIRGFHEEDTMQLTLFRVREGHNAETAGALYEFLSELRYGWWQSTDTLRQRLEQLRPSLRQVWQQETPVRGRDPEGVYIQYLELPRQPEGTYVLTIQAGELIRAALINISAIGVVSKVARGVTEVWCTDLRTGQPIPNVEVRVYGRPPADNPGQFAAQPLRLVAEGRTNAQGLWRVSATEWASDEWRKPLLAVRSPRTGALVHWGRLSFGSYHFGSGGKHSLVGTIYTERPVYRPGDTIHFKGIVRIGELPDYQIPPADTPVRVEIYSLREELVHQTRVALNDWGSFHFDFPTSPEAETGYYRVVAAVGEYGQVETYVPLSAYRKPTYKVHIRTDQPMYVPGETIRAEIRTEYYFGMPVPNTQLNYFLYRAEKFYWADYADDAATELEEEDEDYWYYYEGSSPYGQVIDHGTITTDASGRAVLRLRADKLLPQEPSLWGEISQEYEYTLEVYAISEGWEGAKASARFDIASSVWKVRLIPGASFGEPNRPYRYTLRITDRRTGQPVQARVRWQAGQMLMAGDRPRYEAHASGTIATDAQGVGQFEFTPTIGGDWQIRISGRDTDGNLWTVSDTLWLVDRDYIPWWGDDAQQRKALEVRLQKYRYEPGEPIDLAIRTPHRDATFYVTLEGRKLYYSQVVKAQGAVTRVRIPLTREHILNAYVSVCMVRNKELIQRVLSVRVGTQAGVLKVALQTDKMRYQPRETLTARIQTTDAQGRPVPAEVSLAVVDEAIYSVIEDRPASIRQAFYGRVPNDVITDFSAVWLALQGDKGAEETIRRDFPDTAYWQPTIRTDARGQATVRLRLPDNLTEWRLTAIGHSRDTKIGFARASVKVAKDLMARLRLPLWLAEGDTTEISTVISNDTPQPLVVRVELRTPEGVRARTVAVPANNSLALNWAYKATTVGKHKFTLVAREVNGRLSDAEERALEVEPLEVYEADTRVVLLDKKHTLTLNLQPNAQLERTMLTVQSIPSILPVVVNSIQYLVDYPHGCVEQTISRFVPAVIAQRVLKEAGVPLDAETERKLTQVVRHSLERLQRAQHESGGWGWWEGTEPAVWLTAYAVWGLHKAKEAGVAVPQTMYERGVNALRKQVERGLDDLHEELAFTSRMRTRNTELLFALGVLAEVGAEPPDALRDTNHAFYKLVRSVQGDHSEYLPQLERLWLIRIFQRWQELPNAEQLLNSLWRATISDALETTHLIDWLPQRTDTPWWYYSHWAPEEVQAVALQALVREKASVHFGSARRHEQLIQKTAIGLLMDYRERSWYTSRDTALAVEALLEYMSRSTLQPFVREVQYEVWLNGQRVHTVVLHATDRHMRLPAQVLRNLPWRQGENTLMLRPVRGAPLVSVVLKQALPVNLREADSPTGPLRLRVYRVERPEELSKPGERLRPLQSGDSVQVGDLLRIDVEAHLPRKLPRLDYTVLETPFPAGCAPFDTEAFLRLWWWRYELEQIRDDRAVSYRREWTQGNAYRYSLLVRAETPGEYTILPAHLWGMYAPYEAYSNGFQLRIVGR